MLLGIEIAAGNFRYSMSFGKETHSALYASGTNDNLLEVRTERAQSVRVRLMVSVVCPVFSL